MLKSVCFLEVDRLKLDSYTVSTINSIEHLKQLKIYLSSDSLIDDFGYFLAEIKRIQWLWVFTDFDINIKAVLDTGILERCNVTIINC